MFGYAILIDGADFVRVGNFLFTFVTEDFHHIKTLSSASLDSVDEKPSPMWGSLL